MKIANVGSVGIYSGLSNQVKPQYNLGQNFYSQFSKNASNAIKNNTLSLINFKGNDSQKIDEIVEKLEKEYGVKAEFTSLVTAEITLEAIEEFVKLNDKKMFEGLEIAILQEDADWIWSTHGDYDTNEYVVKLNNKFNKEEFQEYAQNQYDSCYTSSNNLKYDFYVVLGEFLSFKYNSYAYTYNTRLDSFSNSFAEVARKVGSSSMNNFSRFNSTYIASMMCGAEIPPDAKKYYIENGGPKINLPPAKITKNPFENTHSFTSVEEASKYLEKYGIESEFANLKLANLVVESIEDFIEINNNPDMFNGLKIEKKISENMFTFGSMYSKYDYKLGEILDSKISFNQTYDIERHKNSAWRNYFAGHYASPSEKYSIYHELAHWLDFQSRPEDYSRTSDKYRVGEFYVNDYGKTVYGNVSGYAQKSSLEFVAEYVAARMCGLKFPKDVDKQYEICTNLDLKFPC